VCESGKFYAAMENLQNLSAACDVDYIHGAFPGGASAIFKTSRGDFADSDCAISHEKKFITTEPQVRLKNLHLDARTRTTHVGDTAKWMRGLLCTKADWAICSAARRRSNKCSR
jgi:hypothetical protein